MKRTSVYLSKAEERQLARVADRRGISQAEVIRQAIRSFGAEEPGTRDYRPSRSGEGPGD